MNSLSFVLTNMLINFALMLLFVRFMIQLAQIDGSEPLARATYRLTGVVDIFTRIFPNMGGGRISLAAVVLMLLLYLINIAANNAILGVSMTGIELFFVGSLSAIMKFLQLVRYTMIASAVCSLLMVFLNINNSIMFVLMQLSEPIVAPFRRFVPNLGMIDLSFLAALFSLLLLENFIGIIGRHIWGG
ncbi:YggT family protein [Moraxella canis]|uniref:YggT family protein n=1 Tax=Moraxella canis TaxID=90239 RepID=A0ABZ0X043_9GAMM|nr:YggT family protein [Moraxella canis]WQE04664.1 YggT family protein [Moraxella canis]